MVNYTTSESESEDADFANFQFKVKPKKYRKKIEYPKMKIKQLFNEIKHNVKYEHEIVDRINDTKLRKEGKFPGIIVLGEKLQSKYTTRIENLECFGIDVEQMAEVLCAKLNTKGKVQ